MKWFWSSIAWGMNLSLATKYAVVSSFVLTAAAVAIGSWLAAQLEESVVRNTANATALYMESFISPIAQQLASGNELSPGAHRALEEIISNTPLGERVASYKIWKPGGLIVEASNDELIGQTFEPTANLRAAWTGEVRADFEELRDPEDIGESALELPLLEIYSPIREVWSGEVIAVAEFYEVNHQLRVDLIRTRRQAWLAVLAAGVGLGSILYAIVLSGSRTIERQRRDLDGRMAELKDLAENNWRLRLRVQGAAARAAAGTERSLRRIGADLHDGPAQYLAFAALRLDGVRRALPDARAEAELDRVRDAVAQAMNEVRAISRGLSVPDIAERPVAEIVQRAVEGHHARCGVPVALALCCDDALPHLDQASRICVFRFVQEGLHNASQHGGGADLSVDLACSTARLTVAVRDRGPGLPKAGEDTEGLGLAGLADRVESLGGSFIARNRAGGGAELKMTLEFGGRA